MSNVDGLHPNPRAKFVDGTIIVLTEVNTDVFFVDKKERTRRERRTRCTTSWMSNSLARSLPSGEVKNISCRISTCAGTVAGAAVRRGAEQRNGLSQVGCTPRLLPTPTPFQGCLVSGCAPRPRRTSAARGNARRPPRRQRQAAPPGQPREKR